MDDAAAPAFAMTWLEKLCEARGLRVTEHRRIVLEVLATTAGHFCARDIHRRAAAGHLISLATVYRALGSLVDAGIVTRHSFHDGEAHYELVNGSRHDHMIDISTGEIVEVDERALEDLMKKVAQALGYELLDYRLKIFAERLPSHRQPRSRKH